MLHPEMRENSIWQLFVVWWVLANMDDRDSIFGEIFQRAVSVDFGIDVNKVTNSLFLIGFDWMSPAWNCAIEAVVSWSCRRTRSVLFIVRRISSQWRASTDSRSRHQQIYISSNGDNLSTGHIFRIGVKVCNAKNDSIQMIVKASTFCFIS